MSMKISELLSVKKVDGSQNRGLVDVLQQYGLQDSWFVSLITPRMAPWVVITHGEGKDVIRVLLYSQLYPVAVLDRPEIIVDFPDSLSDLAAHLATDEAPEDDFNYPYLATVNIEGKPVWICDLFKPEYIDATLDPHDRFDEFTDTITDAALVTVKPNALIETVGETHELNKPMIEAPEEENVETQIVPEFRDAFIPKFDPDFDTDYIVEPPMPAKKQVKTKDSEDFFSGYQGFTLQTQLNAMRKEYSSKEVWAALTRVVNHFVRNSVPISVEDSKIAYQAQLKFSFLQLLFGSPEDFVVAFEIAAKVDSTERFPTVKSYRQLDTISSRLAQSHDSKGTVMKMSPHPRKGEMVLYLNFFSEAHPILFTAGKFMPVLQARCNEFNTREVIEFVKVHAESRIKEVPDTLWLTHELNDKDLDLVADIAYEKDTNAPGTFAISFNTQGGRIFDEVKEKISRFTLDPLATLLAEGLPFIYYLKNAYKYDKAFRKYWDERKRNQLQKRQEDLSDYVDDLIITSEDFYRSYRLVRGAANFSMVPVAFDAANKITPSMYQSLVDSYHHQLRTTVMIELVEQGLFVGQRFMTSIMPNDSHAIQVVNDLTLAGLNVEAHNSYGYFNVGHLSGPMCITMRPNTTPADKKVGVDSTFRSRYDSKRGNGNAIIDLRMVADDGEKPRVLYVGAGSWERRLNGTLGSDTRNVIYYDYEPVESKKSSKTGLFEHTREDMTDNFQWKHVQEQCDRLLTDKDLFVVGIIVPFRAAVMLFDRYGARVKAVMPAPYPAEGSFYALITKEFNKGPATFKHVYLILQMKYAALFYSNAVYRCGYNGVRRLLQKKLSVFTEPEFGAMSHAWYLKMKARYGWQTETEREGTAKWKVNDDQSRLLRNDPNAVKRANINQALLDRKRNYYVTRKNSSH